MRYFFHIKDADKVTRDLEGSVLSDPIAAGFEARMIAREFTIESLRGGSEIEGQQIEITDETGSVVETVVVRDMARAP
jgi:hypothetical protein